MQKNKIRVPIPKPRNPLVQEVMRKGVKKHKDRKKEFKNKHKD